MGKIAKKTLSIITVLLLLFYQSFFPVIALAQEAVSKPSTTPVVTAEPVSEATPAPLETPQPSLEPAPGESPLPSESPEPATEPDSIPKVDENLTAPVASESAVIDTNPTESQASAQLTASVWQTNPDGSVTTTGNVTLNTTYTAPQNDKTSVTFTKLPEGPGTLTIKQIILSREDKEDLGAFSDIAYEITSTMVDGTFEYTLTLPTPTTENVEVKASEDGQQFVAVDGESVSGDVVTITGLTHFTIFVVVGEIDDSNNVTSFEFENESDAVINEFVYNPSSGNKEWIELYNRGGEEISLTNWQICERTLSGNERCDNLSGTIAASGFFVYEYSTGSLSRLNNTGDTISLKNSNEILVSQVSYKDESVEAEINAQNIGSVSAGQSVGRITDGDRETTWDSFPTPTKNASNRTNVYVDVNGSGSEYGTQNNPFFSIQQGIDNVASGGIVNIRSGDYYLNDDFDGYLELNRSVTLQGPGVSDPNNLARLFSDCDWVINITANNAKVQGLYVSDDSGNCYPLIRVDSGVSGATITGNEISEGYRGINLRPDSSNNTVSNNIFHDNDVAISISGSPNNTISGNEIYNNGRGISFRSSQDCEDVCDISGNTVSGNNIHDNDGDGVYVGGGREVELTFSSLTISDNNTINSNEGYGIYFDNVTGAELNIVNNTITNNAQDGIYIDQVGQQGDVSSVSIVNISGNTITNNVYDWGDAGIYINNVYDSIVNIKDNTEISNNSGRGIYICSEGECENSTVTISGNHIEDNSSEGISLYRLRSSILSVENNEILSNGDTGFEIEYIGRSESEEETSPSTASILGNTIGGVDSGNRNYGIYIGETDNDSTIIIGITNQGNTISDNSNAGIYLNDSVTGVGIIGNTITGNGTDEGEGEGDILFTGIVVNNAQGNVAHRNNISGNIVGVQNNDEENAFDARENWWGSSSGPSGSGSGTGDEVSNNVNFEPWCLDEDCDHVFFNPPENSLLEDVSYGLPPGATLEDTPSLSFLSDEIFTIADSGGTSTVTIPTGVVITRTDGEDFDAGELTSDDVNVNSLAGLGTGVVADGALQWGLPNIELTFTSAITLSIFVGTALNGQTLNVVRSTTGSGGWTSTGIVSPGTCVVANGLCTFQATRASYFATNRSTASASSTSGATQATTTPSGPFPAPVCHDTKPGSAPTLLSASGGSNSVTLTWSKAANPLTYYLATYGLSSGSQQYGNPNIGGADSTSYTVSNLSGGTTYYFKVRAGNGCAPGDFSNEVSATPGGGFIEGPAAGFAPGVLGTSTQEGGNVGIGDEKSTESVSGTSTGMEPGATLGEQAETKPSGRNWILVISVLTLGVGAGYFIFRKFLRS